MATGSRLEQRSVGRIRDEMIITPAERDIWER